MPMVGYNDVRDASGIDLATGDVTWRYWNYGNTSLSGPWTLDSYYGAYGNMLKMSGNGPAALYEGATISLFIMQVSTGQVGIVTFLVPGGNSFTNNWASGYGLELHEPSRTANLEPEEELHEATLNGKYIKVKVVDDCFKQGITAEDFTLNNAPEGLTISSISNYKSGVDWFEVDLYLNFDGSLHGNDVTDLSVTALDSALESGNSIITDTTTIISTPIPITYTIKIAGRSRIATLRESIS